MRQPSVGPTSTGSPCGSSSARRSRRRRTVRAPCGFDYAVVRVVPRVDREEFLNAGVVVWCLAQDYLAARVALDVDRLKALDPAADAEAIRAHLEAVPRICAGDPAAGPVARFAGKGRL